MKDHPVETNGRIRPLKTLLLLAIALAAGGGGTYLARQQIESTVARQTAAHIKPEPVTLPVVVVDRDMQPGERITEYDLSVLEMPEQYVDSGSVDPSTASHAIGQRLSFPVDGGRPLLWAHLVDASAAGLSRQVDPGLRAMTVRVDEINAISGFLQPGDQVDLLLSHGTGEQQQITPIMEKLAIIATGEQTEIDPYDEVSVQSFSTITVHVSPSRAQTLTLAQQVGRITAILRHPEDDTALDEDPLTVAQLLGQIEPPAKKVILARSKPAIEYIVGGQ